MFRVCVRAEKVKRPLEEKKSHNMTQLFRMTLDGRWEGVETETKEGWSAGSWFCKRM